MDPELTALLEAIRHHAVATGDTRLRALLDGLPHDCPACRCMTQYEHTHPQEGEHGPRH